MEAFDFEPTSVKQCQPYQTFDHLDEKCNRVQNFNELGGLFNSLKAQPSSLVEILSVLLQTLPIFHRHKCSYSHRHAQEVIPYQTLIGDMILNCISRRLCESINSPIWGDVTNILDFLSDFTSTFFVRNIVVLLTTIMLLAPNLCPNLFTVM